MSLLGIDIGTTGCKSVVFSNEGETLSSSYAEYDISRPHPGYAELDSRQVWNAILSTIADAASHVLESDPVRALSVASLGEAVVPVSSDRQILGPSILINDSRGNEYVEAIRREVSDQECFRITGNAVGEQFGLTKLMWIREHEPKLYEKTYKFLNWSSFVEYMLGAEPRVDFSLANRFLLFDLRSRDWSPRLLAAFGLDRAKLPECVPAGTPVGTVSSSVARSLSLPEGTLIVSGTHDQCSNALGSGVIRPGNVMYGMGTFPTVLPVYETLSDPSKMVQFGLNMEHHAVPGAYVSFAYHMGGSIVKWYRDTFAAAECKTHSAAGKDIYSSLFDELPNEAAPLFVLPHFAPMGPPDFVSDSAGVVLGLKSYTTRGAVLKAIVEANSLAIKVSVENLASLGVSFESFTAVGGGSRSDAAVQIGADIMNRHFVRPAVTEAGAHGVAILAGSASGVYDSAADAAERLIRIDREFEPDRTRAEQYAEVFELYKRFSPTLVSLTREWGRLRLRLEQETSSEH